MFLIVVGWLNSGHTVIPLSSGTEGRHIVCCFFQNSIRNCISLAVTFLQNTMLVNQISFFENTRMNMGRIAVDRIVLE